jgi:two-component system NtrC family sensor kinase
LPAEQHKGQKSRRTVAGRLLASFVVVLAAFAITVGWSFLALREAARDATLVRDGYVQVLTAIGEALAQQNVMNTQLNHITAAKNPADVRQWIETARHVRPLTLQKLRDSRSGLREDDGEGGLSQEIAGTVDALEAENAASEAQFDNLFVALSTGDTAKAEAMRDRLLEVETEGARRLRSLRQRVEAHMTILTDAAQRRESRAVLLLIGLSVLTLVVGLALSVYARRVLTPLTRVTERARAVAGGDLAPRAIVATDDEIGELAKTFEDMVLAIRRARAELVQAERLATIGKMAAHITHEVRNPLSSIGLNLELLEEEVVKSGTNPEARQLIGAIQGEVDRLTRISEQYLAAVREPKLELVREAVEDIVRECHTFMARELELAGVKSTVEVHGDVPRAEVDEARLRQALVNLLRNAREALTKGGRVDMVVRATDEHVVIEVEDDGPGIPDDVRSSIFDPFYTTKRHGTGLGLAVTRSIVEAHGGHIGCEARGDEPGTRFTISLPIAATPKPGEARSDEATA